MVFKSTIVKNAYNETEELCLFVNPIGNTNIGETLFFELDYTSTSNSTWEFYHNPKITSNGTIQTVTKVGGGVANNTLDLYASPIVTSYGNPLRKFIIQALVGVKKFCSRVPMIQLEPGNSILVRRLKQGSGVMTATWTWHEKSI